VLLLTAGYFFYCFDRAINGGMRTLVVHMEEMASGDLSRSVEVKGGDETALLMRALVDMQQSLRETVAQVRSSSEQIIEIAGEVAAGTTDLSRRTEQSAANLEETAAAMEQIGSRVATATDGSQQASQLASGIAQISTSIRELDQLTLENAALVEQTAAASDTLKAQAQKLGTAVQVFKLGWPDGAGSAPPPVRCPAARWRSPAPCAA
jgi:methyl-accepting chemotaxis protein